jgi:anti-sigma factor RsiW
MKNFREIENLSAYLDGQLDKSDAAQVEARLKTDPELDSVLRDLRAARGILRKLPARKAPRNFTLTRQMVGLKPPLPRTYSLFRFATAFAAILFVMSFSVNMLSPFVSFGAPAAPGFGYGGGGDAAMEAPAATEEAPAAAAEEPMIEMAPAPAEEGTRIVESTPTPALKQPEESTAQDQAGETANQTPVEEEAPASFNWTMLFLVIAIAGGVILWVMRFTAKNKWR